MARMAAALRLVPDDVGVVLPFQEVVDALGFVSERRLGLNVVPIDAIVGSVDRGRDFDRRFRPTSGRARARWEQIATAMRRGDALPPVDLYKIGEIYFVRDGHHRVSVACALGHKEIDAYVTEVITRVGADRTITLADLPLKSHERVFFERVPLPADARARSSFRTHGISPSSPKASRHGATGPSRTGASSSTAIETARLWLETDYRPVVRTLREAELIDRRQTETEAYMRIVAERYRLLRTHTWNEEVLRRVLEGRSARGAR